MAATLGRRLAGLLGAGALLVAGACGTARSNPSTETRTSAPSSGAPGSGLPDRSVTEVVRGLTSPWDVLSLADGRLLISERDRGDILLVDGSTARVVRHLPEAEPSGEGGLLGLALSPDRRTLFAYLTAAADNRIVAMSWDGARLGPPRVILRGIPKGSRHNGGRMVVGPDGYLYVGTGETGRPELAQDRSSLGGKILRLSLDGRPAPGNPYGNEVWSYGHRNVEGLAFDPQGRLWASEFGEQTWDELNLITRGGNYGWPEVEGSGDLAGRINPKVVWPTDQASPSGLAYAGGSLWLAALRGARLWQIPVSGADPQTPIAHLTGQYGRLRAVSPVAGGAGLLVVTSNTDGRGDVRDGDDRVLRLPLP